MSISDIDSDNFDNIAVRSFQELAYESKLNHLAQRRISEIEFACHARMERNISLITQEEPNNEENEPELSTDNLAKEYWILKASPPFLENVLNYGADGRQLPHKLQLRILLCCISATEPVLNGAHEKILGQPAIRRGEDISRSCEEVEAV
ncbi:hypothetical protein Aduo_018388 [Ancylostoma duodenale]